MKVSIYLIRRVFVMPTKLPLSLVLAFLRMYTCNRVPFKGVIEIHGKFLRHLLQGREIM